MNKFRPIFLMLFLCMVFSHSFAQSGGAATAGPFSFANTGDAQAARQYAVWAQQAIDEGRWSEALAGLERAADFASVSSDISYLLAIARCHEGKSRLQVMEALDKAIETNRWVSYTENDALLFKAEHLIAMRRYASAIAVLDQIGQSGLSANGNLQADSAMLRILAFRGLAFAHSGGSFDRSSANMPGQAESFSQPESDFALTRFRTLVREAMDRFPRDPRPLRIFFEYAHNRTFSQIEITPADADLLALVLRRLPFFLEIDPELAWLAAPFMRNTEDARRHVMAYRAGGYSGAQARDFRPNAASIPIALNLGLIDDAAAAEELFSGARGINSPVPYEISAGEYPALDLNVITETFRLLRSEEGRDNFTQKLLAFTGIIYSDEDKDGHIDSYVNYINGVCREFYFDKNQANVFDFRILFLPDGIPVFAEIPFAASPLRAAVFWERYPHTERAIIGEETFIFRPADFQFAPVSLAMLGGSTRLAGILYPVLSNQTELTRRLLVFSAASVSRPSAEIDGAVEQIFLENGIPVQAVETLAGRQVSVTEFERGLPVIQHIDLDLDGRMETVRRFRRPPEQDLIQFDPDEKFDFRSLIASSESDWSGDGRHKTGEVYLDDGSVVYLFDMDGSGMMNYTETDAGNRE